MWFWAYVFVSDWCLFQLIVVLKPDFNCWSNFALSWVDKVTTETKSFASALANLTAPVELVITQIDEQVKMRLISQLVNSISRGLHKLLKYFNGTIILASFVLPSAEYFLLFLL